MNTRNLHNDVSQLDAVLTQLRAALKPLPTALDDVPGLDYHTHIMPLYSANFILSALVEAVRDLYKYDCIELKPQPNTDS